MSNIFFISCYENNSCTDIFRINSKIWLGSPANTRPRCPWGLPIQALLGQAAGSGLAGRPYVVQLHWRYFVYVRYVCCIIQKFPSIILLINVSRILSIILVVMYHTAAYGAQLGRNKNHVRLSWFFASPTETGSSVLGPRYWTDPGPRCRSQEAQSKVIH